MYDPYGRDTPGLADPANDLIDIIPDDDTDIAQGIKALRIFNTTAAAIQVAVITLAGRDQVLDIPANALWVEPLRVTRVLETGTSADAVIKGYTDGNVTQPNTP